MDANFSSALHNRTGKYFVGKAILEDLSTEIRDTYYWRTRTDRVPTGLHAKLLGQGMVAEQALHITSGLGKWGGLRTHRPMLHLDPSTTAYSRLRSDDIVLCHDLGPLTHPDLFTPFVVRLYREVYRYLTIKQPKMVFVSQASRTMFCKITGGVPSMDVIYPPVRIDYAPRHAEPVPGVTKPFLLTVGSVGRRKNQGAAIAAFARSGLAQLGFTYVICGAREPGADRIERLAGETDGVVMLPYVTEPQLKWLYANARGFVLVSLLEGFGLPVAEAVVNGLVPLLSRDSVLGEVAGPTALYSDPTDEDEIARTMLELAMMSDDERSNRLEGLNQSIKRFSRARFAREWQDLAMTVLVDGNEGEVDRDRRSTDSVHYEGLAKTTV